METLGVGWKTEPMSLAVGLTLMKNIHLRFFVPYNLFHTHSFHITKYKINIYIEIKYTNCTKTERYKPWWSAVPDIQVILVDKGCLIHDSYIFDNRPIGISSKRHPEYVSRGDLFKHSHSHFKQAAASDQDKVLSAAEIEKLRRKSSSFEVCYFVAININMTL